MTDYNCDVVAFAGTTDSIASLQLEWRVSLQSNIRGNESDIIIPISISLTNQTRNTEAVDLQGNNIIDVVIPVSAVAKYTVAMYVSVRPVSVRSREFSQRILFT